MNFSCRYCREIYPNPARESVTIRADFGQFDNVAAMLVNSLGQEIGREILSETNSQFNLRSKSQEVYFMHLTASGKTTTQKLVLWPESFQCCQMTFQRLFSDMEAASAQRFIIKN